MMAFIAAPQDAVAAEPTRLELAREAATALKAAGGEQETRRSHIAQVLVAEGLCAEAKAVFPDISDSYPLYVSAPAARRCLDPIARSWVSLLPASREEAKQLHAAGAYLRRTGRLQEGEEAIGRASVALAASPIHDDVELDSVARWLNQLATGVGASLPSDLWLARSSEIAVYEGTPLAAARLATYLPAAQRVGHGLDEAYDLARYAYKAGRPDLARAYLDCLPRRHSSGTRDEVRARVFAEFGEVDRAAALLPRIASDKWHLILFEDKGALAARMIESEAITTMAAADRLNTLITLSSTLLYHSDRIRADLAVNRALAILHANPMAPLQTRMQLAFILAELGRTDTTLDLIARAPSKERVDVGREALQGALNGGQTALFNLVRARCGCDPEAERLRFGLTSDWLSPIQRRSRFELWVTLIASIPTINRVDAMGHAISGLTTLPEWRVAQTLIDAERDPATRSRLLVRLGYAMINAGRAGEAAVVADTARVLASGRPEDAYDVAWLLHRAGRTTKALAIARTLEPQKKAELLTNMASQPTGL